MTNNVSIDGLTPLSDMISDQRYEETGEDNLVRLPLISALLTDLHDEPDYRTRVRDNLAIGLELAQA